jgi:hypothetical protein
MTRQEIETALDAGRLYAKRTSGNAWRCRRNGRTQTWKTRPDDYRIPFKCGLRECGQLTPAVASPDYFTIR